MSKRLERLAKGCANGACNAHALTVELGEALKEHDGFGLPHESNDFKYILGHISFLAGEGMGPSDEVVSKYNHGV